MLCSLFSSLIFSSPCCVWDFGEGGGDILKLSFPKRSPGFEYFPLSPLIEDKKCKRYLECNGYLHPRVPWYLYLSHSLPSNGYKCVTCGCTWAHIPDLSSHVWWKYAKQNPLSFQGMYLRVFRWWNMCGLAAKASPVDGQGRCWCVMTWSKVTTCKSGLNNSHGEFKVVMWSFEQRSWVHAAQTDCGWKSVFKSVC